MGELLKIPIQARKRDKPSSLEKCSPAQLKREIALKIGMILGLFREGFWLLVNVPSPSETRQLKNLHWSV